MLTTSIVADATDSFSSFFPNSTQETDNLDSLLSREKKHKGNAQGSELNARNFWRGNLFEQKLLQAKIENAVQRAELRNINREHEKALSILISTLRASSKVFDNYLEVFINESACGTVQVLIALSGYGESFVPFYRTSHVPSHRDTANALER